MKWHDDVLELTLRTEFERKLFKVILQTIARLKKDAMNEEDGISAAQLELKTLTELQHYYRDEIASTNKLRKVLYQTNELISASLVEKEMIREFMKDEVSRHRVPLLHGVGWRFKYEVMKQLRQRGYAAFLTYGGLLEPHNIDVVAHHRDTPINLNLEGKNLLGVKSIFK